MSTSFRIALTSFCVVASSLMVAPGLANASVSYDIGFSFPPDSITVGDTDLPVTIRLANRSDDVDDGQSITICNNGDAAPCGAPTGTPPRDAIGIGMLASCGEQGASSTTCATPDPGVFVPTTATATGGGSCTGMEFAIATEASGTWRFTPLAPAPTNLVLADDGTTCEINFNIDVVKFPSFDWSPTIAGRQIGILASSNGYSIDPINGVEPADDSASSIRTVGKAPTTINTTASAAVALGAGTLTDTAVVSGRAFPDSTANVVFSLYGPSDPDCSGAPVFTSTVAIGSGANEVTSAPYTPAATGTHRWIAAYAGDSNNLPASGGCGDAGETVDVQRAQPVLTTDAGAAVSVGSPLTDTATVTGRVSPLASTVSFALYGPGDTDCSTTAVFTDSVALPLGSNSVSSAAFTPSTTGIYRWIATYSGDANNLPAAGGCGDPGETVEVERAQPVLTTDAGAAVTLGSPLSDSATVTGRVSAGAATLDFRLYGPNDADCSGTPAFEQLGVPFGANDPDTVTSAGYTPSATGIYRWIAAYSGDANNLPAVGGCGDPGETVEVLPAQPVLTTNAGAAVTVGSPLTDSATVTGRVNAGAATLDFRLYGPNDADCSGTPAFEQLGVPFAASDPDTVTSAGYTPTATGTYRWVVRYSGDTNNTAAVGSCGDPDETVEVTPAQPSIVTSASPGVVANAAPLTDEAAVNGRVNPQSGGTVSFRLYGPDDNNCSSAPVFQDLDVPYPIAGGNVTSASYVPTAPGSYRWVASYSGDSNNNAVAGICGDPSETVQVSPPLANILPATGSTIENLMFSGGVLLLAGVGLAGAGRRRRFAG